MLGPQQPITNMNENGWPCLERQHPIEYSEIQVITFCNCMERIYAIIARLIGTIRYLKFNFYKVTCTQPIDRWPIISAPAVFSCVNWPKICWEKMNLNERTWVDLGHSRTHSPHTTPITYSDMQINMLLVRNNGRWKYEPEWNSHHRIASNGPMELLCQENFHVQQPASKKAKTTPARIFTHTAKYKTVRCGWVSAYVNWEFKLK